MTTYTQRAKKIASAEKKVAILEVRIAKQKDLGEQLRIAQRSLEWIREMPITDSGPELEDPAAEDDGELAAELEDLAAEIEGSAAEPEAAEATFSDAGDYAG